MNPYWGQDFFTFFVVLFKRLTGQLPGHLASDEVQLLVLMGVSLSTILLGTFLTLKKMTMMANALSHTTLLGIVVSYIFFSSGPEINLNGTMLLLAAIVSALLTALLTEWVRDVLKLHEDAAIGYVFTTLFALGIVLVTLFTRNSHIGVEVITGNVDALHPQDISLAWGTALINLLFIVLFFPQWVITAFDERLSSSLGISVRWFHYLLMFLTALSMISAFRAVGVLLVLALIVGPPLIARQWTHRVLPLLILAISLGFGFTLIGVALSRHLLSVYQTPLSTGAIVVTLISLGFLVSSLLTFRKKKGLMI